MERMIRRFLAEKEKEGLLRSLRPTERLGGARIRVDARDHIDFSSNDYLGLASHPAIVNAARSAASPAFGSSASRLMSGTGPLHASLEEKTAAFKGKPAALVFNSGYQANVGVISALMSRSDVIFSDRLNHASIIDGIKLSGAKLFRFRHNDTEHLEELLKEHRKNYRNALIVTETVFSMDGDQAPIGEISALCKKNDCLFMVDEAHATGVFGQHGAGMLEEIGDRDAADIVMGTFSKALGGFGAYVAVSKEIRDYLVNTCRSFIYSTSLPYPVIAADIAALDVVPGEHKRRMRLKENSAYLRDSLRSKGFEVRGESQIIPIIIGDNARTLKLSQALKDKGYWVTPVRPPTVPDGEARLRISLSSDHGRDVLERFCEDIAEAARETL